MAVKIKSNVDKLFRDIEKQINKEVQKTIQNQSQLSTMSNKLTRNEIITLKHLSDGKQHNDTPQGLTDAQFYAAAKSLYARDMVYAAFVTGGTVECAMIKTAGVGALDDLIQEIREKLERRLLNQYDHNEIAVWSWLADNEEHFEDGPEGIDYDDFEAIMKDMIDGGYVREPITKDDGYKLSLKGRRQVEMWIQDKLPANVIKKNETMKDLRDEYELKIEELKKQLSEKDAIIEKQEIEIKTLKQRTRAEGAYDKKVVAKVLIPLLEHKTTFGLLQKQDIAKLLSRLTGFSEEALKKLTDPEKIELKKSTHGAQVNEANELLSKAGVRIHLSCE